jgi:hypothetical protein
MTINNLAIPYPDFKFADTINADEFDANNDAIKTKVNEVVDLLNGGNSSVVTLNQSPVTSLSFSNKWVNYDGVSSHVWKDSVGVVHLYIFIKNGTSTFGTTLCTLPTTFRPTSTFYLPYTSNNNGVYTSGLCAALPSGVVNLQTSSGNDWLLIKQDFKA